MNSGPPIGRRSALGLLGAAALVGCGRHATDRLVWWGMGTEGENAPKLLPTFERQTGIRVEVQSLPYTGVHEKLLAGVAGGSLPDVMLLPNGWVPEMAMLGAIGPVPTAQADATRGQFPALVAGVSVGKRPHAVPWLVDSWVQYYRRDLLAEAGWEDGPPARWDEWARMAADFKRRFPDRWVTLHLLNWPEPLMNFGAMAGEPLLRDRGARGNFASPGFRAALAFYKTTFDQGWAPKLTGVEAGDTVLDFTRGRYAILPSFSETLGQLRRPVYRFAAERWAVAETPGPTGREGVWAAGSCLAVARTSARAADAWALVRHVTAVPAQLAFHRLTGDLPARPAAWAAPELAHAPPEQTFARAIARGVVGANVPESQRIAEEVQLVAEHMVRGEYGVDAAAAEMNRRTDAILAKRRWLLDRGLLI